MAEYNEQKHWLDETANIFSDIYQWVTWWDARKYHMFPAFRHSSYSNITLAESCNATLKCHTQLWLLEAAWGDTSIMLTQINEFHSFLTEATSSSGKEPYSPACNRENKTTQICAAKAYAVEFSNTCAQHEAIEENTNLQVFVLASGARNRPLKIKTGMVGTFLHIKKPQIAAVNVKKYACRSGKAIKGC